MQQRRAREGYADTSIAAKDRTMMHIGNYHASAMKQTAAPRYAVATSSYRFATSYDSARRLNRLSYLSGMAVTPADVKKS
jgi:hypothetical protein